MNNLLLEERASKINTFIKGTNIAVLEDVEALDEEKIKDIKDVIGFLIAEGKLTPDENGYVSVESEDEDWGIVKIADHILEEYANSDEYCYYEIVRKKKEFIETVNDWIGDEDKYKKEEEALNCKEFQGEVYKIRKGLYLLNIDTYY